MAKRKFIIDFPNYAITKDGRVWSKKWKRWLKQQIVRDYKRVGLYKNNKAYWKLVHRLVLETFVGPCPEGKESCHNNGVRDDNRLENLRWGTRSENVIDSVKHGTHYPAKLTEQDVRMIIYMWRTRLFLQKEIADIYKVGQDTVSRIINRKRWEYIWSK